MTTLVEEEPFASVVVEAFLSSTCSRCFATTTPVDSTPIESFPRCQACHIVHYCGKKCQKEDWKDHKVECKLLQKALELPNSNTRLVSRMLLRAKREPDFKAFNGRTWNSLMDNIGKRMEDPVFRFRVAPDLFQTSKAFMGELTPSIGEVLSAWGKMKTNSLSVFNDGLAMLDRGSALYIGQSVLNHSCRPDCFNIWKGSKMILKTTKANVEYSDKLTINYIEGRMPQRTRCRRASLKDVYLFVCECEECQGEELDAKRQSGLCQFCSKGWFPLNAPVCSDCGKTAAPKHVEQVRKLNDEIALYLSKMGFCEPGEEVTLERGLGSVAKFISSSKSLRTGRGRHPRHISLRPEARLRIHRPLLPHHSRAPSRPVPLRFDLHSCAGLHECRAPDRSANPGLERGACRSRSDPWGPPADEGCEDGTADAQDDRGLRGKAQLVISLLNC